MALAQKGQIQSISTSDCDKCDDTGIVTRKVEQIDLAGNAKKHPTSGATLYKDVARVCECEEKRIMKARFENAMIPEEYEDARFKDFETNHPVHVKMLKVITEFLKGIPKKEDVKLNNENRRILKGPSLGFIAEFGEMRMKELPANERVKFKRDKNSYGIGKTHLQIAAAKYLINQGYKVLCISDITYIQDLMGARQTGDVEELNKLVNLATKYADIVVWDELGRSRYSEAREDMYYQIINECYKQQKPMLFSSNEDRETLEMKIGSAAFSRLRGMSKDNLYDLSGPDMR